MDMHTNVKALDSNMKTLKSFDTSTLCNKKRDFIALIEQGMDVNDIPDDKKPCSYCFIEYHRDKQSFFAKRLCEKNVYKNDILRMNQKTIDKLNSMGGLRFFVNADYLIDHKDMIKVALDDCLKVGLKAKAITKQIDFIFDFHDHKAITCINYSIDTLACNSMGLKEIAKIKKEYKKIKIRLVVLKDSDFTFYAKSKIDVFCLYHGQSSKEKNFKNYTLKDRKEYGLKYDISNKVCCLTGKCITCKVRCGLN